MGIPTFTIGTAGVKAGIIPANTKHFLARKKPWLLKNYKPTGNRIPVHHANDGFGVDPDGLPYRFIANDKRRLAYISGVQLCWKCIWFEVIEYPGKPGTADWRLHSLIRCANEIVYGFDGLGVDSDGCRID